MTNIIKVRRVIKGMNQQELANAVGVTQGAVSQWENGLSQPSGKIVSKLSEVLDCKPEAILGTGNTPEEHEDSISDS